MSGKFRKAWGGTGYGGALWPVLLCLLVVLIPTACVLWFLNEAVQNERLAVRQKLLVAYRSQLPLLRDRLEAYWQQQAAALEAKAAASSGPAAFAACVATGIADSVVCYDASGRLAYPPVAMPVDVPANDDAWTEASALEHARNDPAVAAAAYGQIAASAVNDSLAARALQAQARCLARSGCVEDSIHVLADSLAKARYARALDGEGRLIAADAQLRALELIRDHSRFDFAQVSGRLATILSDYSTPLLPAAQRRFLMKELIRLTGDVKRFPTLQAEELAAAYLESHPPAVARALRPSGLPDVWHFASPSGRMVALLRGSSISDRAAAILSAEALPQDVRIAVVRPGGETVDGIDYLLPAGPKMPGWRLALSLGNNESAETATNGRVVAYVWIAILVIAAMSIIAMVVAAAFHRQLRSTRLKNDLLATVSHELKTPLASIRLLVDTLLDAQELDVPKTREYLRLVAKENARLSHLIDNFLSFSRMERDKQAFEFASVPAAEIAHRAAEVMAERFQASACRLDVQTSEDLPPLRADADALVTAVLNLLDNAYKYTGDSKQVTLRTYAENGNVCFAVSDNGAGLSPRAIKKVFRPFYQVDRRLSRRAGGCGLGLSIVRFIVTAHGGSVQVESRLGAGSTFTLSIPQHRSNGTTE